MPYIKNSRRAEIESTTKFSEFLVSLERLNEFNVGDFNYLITRMLTIFWNSSKSYEKANSLIGVLECVKQEFYRRAIAPYEDVKIKENGDIF